VLAAERRRTIASWLKERGTVQVHELSACLGVSPSTVRRDLDLLEGEGILRRTHGGAIDVELDRGLALAPGDWAQLGAAAAAQIAPGETVYLGPGEHALPVARALTRRSDVTVITNALHVAAYLADRSSMPVILIGGEVNREHGAAVGHLAELALRELRADRALIGVAGIHVPDGFTGDHLAGVQVMRAVLDVVSAVVVVADAARWGRVGPAYLAPLDVADAVVTSRDAPAAMVWDLVELGVHVIQV